MKDAIISISLFLVLTSIVTLFSAHLFTIAIYHYNLNKVYKILIQGFQNKTLPDDSDIKLLFQKFIGNEKMAYKEFLEDFIIYLRSKNHNIGFNDINERIKIIINQEIKISPFNEVRERERRLLQTISCEAQAKGADSIRHNIDELALALIEKQSELRKCTLINYIGVALSITGLIIGIISLWT